MSDRSLTRKRHRPTVPSWPQVGIVAGVLLNVAGLALENADLIATGSNALAVSAVFLAQRRRNTRRGDTSGDSTS